MIRRSPAEYYFKFLVAHPACYDNRYIQDVAGELKLDFLGDWYIQELRGRVKPPRNFAPNATPVHIPSAKFLRRERLVEVFEASKDMERSYDILSRPRVREIVETMLVSGAPPDAVRFALEQRLGFGCERSAVRVFAHYFWNLELLDSNDFRALLFHRVDGAVTSPTSDVHGQYLALKKTLYTDPRMIAARAPVSKWSAAIAQMSVGVLPRNIDVGKLTQDIKAISLLRTYEAVSSGGVMGAQSGQGYAAVAEMMQRLEGELRDPENELREGLSRVALASAKTEVPSLYRLTAGQHTTNLHPEPKSETEDVTTESNGG